MLVYTRAKGSRSEPDGNLFTVMTMDVSDAAQYTHALRPEDAPVAWNAARPGDEEDEASKAKKMADTANGVNTSKLHYTPFGELRDGPRDTDEGREGNPQGSYVLKSSNFGENWTWTCS